MAQALARWELSGASSTLIAARENAVYKIKKDDVIYALRLHRKNYRSDSELWSELVWMDAVSRGGIDVPAPIPSASGDLFHVIEGVQVDVLTWLSGKTVTEALGHADALDRPLIFNKIGQQMARLHVVSDEWVPPQGFTRCDWDADGLVGDTPLWDRFWCNPALVSFDRSLFEDFRDRAHRDLAQQKGDPDYGLIHADWVGGNVLLNAGKIQLIDFDDGGFGYRAFDIASALVKYTSEPDFPALRAALLDGYRAVRHINLELLDLHMALRAATYVGWNISRMTEENGRARNVRFINDARKFIRFYMDRYTETAS